MIVIAGIWIIASIFFIQKEQEVRKPIALKLAVILTILISILWTSKIFDPALSHFIGATEMNPTFVLAVLIAAAISVAITGPIACVRYLLWKRKNNKWLEEYHKEKEKE